MKLINKFVGPVVLILSVLAILIMYANYSSDMTKQGPATDIGLQTAYALLIISGIGVVAGFGLTAATNPASVLRSAIGVAFMLVVGLISYAISGNEVLDAYKEFNVNAAISQMIGGALILTSTLGILAIIGIIITEVMSAVR